MQNVNKIDLYQITAKHIKGRSVYTILRMQYFY